VLIGLAAVALFDWPKADAIAALGVALFVLRAGWQLGRRTLDVLLDAAPEGVADEIEAVAAAVPGVVRVNSVRARLAGANVLADLHVAVPRGLSVGEVHALREAIARRLRGKVPEAEVLVVPEPVTLEEESVADTVRAAAARQGLPVHSIRVYDLGGRFHIAFDMEAD